MSPKSRGFTLMEASLVIIIIGVAVTAMLELLAVGTSTNNDAASRTTGLSIARAMRENMLSHSYAEVTAMNGRSETPPIDATGSDMTEFSDWTQVVQVQSVDTDNLTANVSDSSPDAVRITVSASRAGERLATISWYQFSPE